MLDAGRAIVLYVDTAMVAARTDDRRSGAPRRRRAGLGRRASSCETATPPEFAASWAFVLRPERDGGTRLIERIRFRVGRAQRDHPGRWARSSGFGVFVMLQRQMAGIRERVERQAGS